MSEKIGNYNANVTIEEEKVEPDRELGRKIGQKTLEALENADGERETESKEGERGAEDEPEIKIQESEKVSLKTVENTYSKYKVFPGRDSGKANISMYGKYSPNMTVVLPLEWYREIENGPRVGFDESDIHAISPLKYRDIPEITDSLGIEFNSTVDGVVPVNFWKSKAGKPCCEVLQGKSIDKASHMLIKTHYDRKTGYGNEYLDEKYRTYDVLFGEMTPEWKRDGEPSPMEKAGLSYFHHARSKTTGAIGNDYYVVPIDYQAEEWDGAPHHKDNKLATERRQALRQAFEEEREEFREKMTNKLKREAESAKNMEEFMPVYEQLSKKLDVAFAEYEKEARKYNLGLMRNPDIRIEHGQAMYYDEPYDFSEEGMEALAERLDDTIEYMEDSAREGKEKFLKREQALPDKQEIEEMAKHDAVFKVEESPSREGMFICLTPGSQEFFSWDKMPEAKKHVADWIKHIEELRAARES